MHKNLTFLIALFAGILSAVNAQESKIYTHEKKDFQDALTLYNNEQYQAAQTIFERVKATTKDCSPLEKLLTRKSI